MEKETSAKSRLKLVSFQQHPTKSLDWKNIKIILQMMASAHTCSTEKQINTTWQRFLFSFSSEREIQRNLRQAG